MNLASISRYAVKLTHLQTGVSTASNAGERMVVPAAIMLAGFGIGLSSFSVTKLLGSHGRRSTYIRMMI